MVIAAAVAALALSATALATRCSAVSGSFTGEAFFPPLCLSPLGVCLHLTLLGSYLETDDFTFDTLSTASEPSDPTKYVYTGSSVISVERGRTILGQDTGVIHIATSDPAPFVTTTGIVGGTRQYSGATGQVVLTGWLGLASGLAWGNYAGTVCKSGDGEA